MTRKRSRRAVLGLAGTSLAALAGCLGVLNDEAEEVEEDAAWLTTPMTDVTTGEEFVIGEIEQPVFLHLFGEWCSTCRNQQGQLDTLYERRGEEVTIIDVTIEEDEGPDLIRQHAEENGFEWTFAVAPQEVTASLSDAFGVNVTIPPNSPVILRCPGGTTKKVPKVAQAGTLEDELTSTC
jgi:thiol-disulfide isomerase/thioredoxin